MMMSMMMLRPHQGHWHPGGGLEECKARRKAAFPADRSLILPWPSRWACRLYPYLFPHCTQSRIFDKYALDHRFLRCRDMKREGRRFMGVCRKLQILAVRVYPDPFRTQIFHQKGVPWSKTAVKIWEESSLYLSFRQIWGVIGAEGSKHGLWGGRRPKDSTGRQNPGLLHKSVLEEQ